MLLQPFLRQDDKEPWKTQLVLRCRQAYGEKSTKDLIGLLGGIPSRSIFQALDHGRRQTSFLHVLPNKLSAGWVIEVYDPWWLQGAAYP